MSVDLWPNEFERIEVKAPVTILREQASALGDKTKNIVSARVDKSRSALGEEPFVYSFVIEAPALNYEYELFSIGHDIEMYPVKIFLGSDLKDEFLHEIDKFHSYVQADNEEEFIIYLKRIFSSEKSVRVIGSILAQSERA